MSNHNIITSGFSTYVSTLMIDGQSQLYFALGTGKSSWDTSGAPEPSVGISALYTEVYRVPIDMENDVVYVDPVTREESETPTSTVRIRAKVSENSYYGAVREFGLFAINATEELNSGTLINYCNHKVMSIPTDVEYIKDIYINT